MEGSMKAVIYARYSSHAQREESIEGQLRVCHEYAAREGIDVINEYIDRAMSATSDQRPSFQQMVYDSAGRGFDLVLVYTLDRLARDRYDAAVYRKKLKDNGVRIVSVTQPIDDSPEGVLIESLLEGLAEYYSKNLARGVLRGMRENALSCKSTGGRTPLGYSVDKVTKEYTVDESAACIVREIFSMYADGHTIAEICDHCNSRGYRTANDKPFTRSSMNTMLTNKKYIGIYVFDDIEIEDGIPAIVDRQLFDRVQERITMGNKAKPRKRGAVDFLLTGKVFCGHCGKPMVGTSGTGKLGKIHYYYSCRNHGNKCIKRAENKDKLENFVLDYILNQFLTPENIDIIADRIMDAMDRDEWTAIMRGLEDQIRDREKRIANLMKAVEYSGDAETYAGRISELQQEKADLETELARKRVENMSFLTKDMIIFWMTDLLAGNDGSDKYKCHLINTFVNAIYIYDSDDEGSDPDGKPRKKRKIVMAFNTSGPESRVTLECSDKCLNRPPLKNCPNTDLRFVSQGRVVVAVLDY